MKKIPVFKIDRFAPHLVMLFGNNAGAALGYVFQAMMARLLTKEDYGLLNALLGLNVLLVLPSSIFISLVTRQWSEFFHQEKPAEIDKRWYSLITLFLGMVVVSTPMAWFCSPWVAGFLKTTRVELVFYSLVGLAFSLVLGLYGPLLVSKQLFGWFSGGAILGALFRILYTYWGHSPQEPILSAVVGTYLSGTVGMLFAVSRSHWPGTRSLRFRGVFPSSQEWIAGMITALASYFMIGVDVALVRRVLNPEEVGLFAQVIVLARIMIFLVGPIATVLLAKTSTAKIQGKWGEAQKTLFDSILLAIGILIVAASVLHLFAFYALWVLTGKSPDPSPVNLLRSAAWCLIPMSVSQLSLQFLFAQHREKDLLGFLGITSLVPLGILFVSSQIIHIFILEGIVGLLLLIYVYFRLIFRRDYEGS